MEHSHEGCQGHGAHVQGKALYRALWIAAFFMLIEVISGIIANSLALISDAAHLFTDVGALGLGLIVVKIAHLPRTPKMSYGYQRAEILGALGSSLALWALCGVLIYEAITRLIHPQPVAGPIVFVVAVIGLIANIVMIRILHPSQGHRLNMRAAYLHVLGDLLGSVGVLFERTAPLADTLVPYRPFDHSPLLPRHPLWIWKSDQTYRLYFNGVCTRPYRPDRRPKRPLSDPRSEGSPRPAHLVDLR